MKLQCRWRNAGHPSVFKVATGEAVHTMGFAYVNGQFLGMNHFPEATVIRRCIQICGGNVKRGLMFFVEAMMSLYTPSAQPVPAESLQTELQALPAAEPPQTLQNLNERGPSAQLPQAEPSKNQTPESAPAGIGAVHPADSSQERQAADGQHSASETRCSGFRISDETQRKPESG